MARRWNNEEVNALIKKVGENYHFLTSALSSTKTKTMVEDKWKKIAADINAMDVNSPPYPIDKVKRKWVDLKSISKKEVAFYKKELLKTGGVSAKLMFPLIFNLRSRKSSEMFVPKLCQVRCFVTLAGAQTCHSNSHNR